MPCFEGEVGTVSVAVEGYPFVPQIEYDSLPVLYKLSDGIGVIGAYTDSLSIGGVKAGGVIGGYSCGDPALRPFARSGERRASSDDGDACALTCSFEGGGESSEA
jgi:hypothetical protein